MKDLECFNTPHEQAANIFPPFWPSMRPLWSDEELMGVNNIFS